MKKSIGTAALLGAMCLAVMPAAPAYAANWVYVSTSTDNADSYYDADTLQRSGEVVTVWRQKDHSRDKTVKYRSSKQLIRYYCSRRSWVIVYIIDYYPNGETEIFEYPAYRQAETVIAPDTDGEKMLEAVCR